MPKAITVSSLSNYTPMFKAIKTKIKEPTFKLQGSYIFQGLPISVENKAGSMRRSMPGEKPVWSTKMGYDYGYIRNTEAKDKEAVDVYVRRKSKGKKPPYHDISGGELVDQAVYVIHQKQIWKTSKWHNGICPDCHKHHTECKHAYDEDKVMLGFDSKEDAIKAYLGQYDSSRFLGPVSTYTLSEFKASLKNSWGKKLPYKNSKHEHWVGVDLDGTSAIDDGWKGKEHIGEPIEKIWKRIDKILSQGGKVKILTARAWDKKAIKPIQDWMKLNNKPILEITNKKDPGMVEIWDDRARRIGKNTGNLVKSFYVDLDKSYLGQSGDKFGSTAMLQENLSKKNSKAVIVSMGDNKKDRMEWIRQHNARMLGVKLDKGCMKKMFVSNQMKDEDQYDYDVCSKYAAFQAEIEDKYHKNKFPNETKHEYIERTKKETIAKQNQMITGYMQKAVIIKREDMEKGFVKQHTRKGKVVASYFTKTKKKIAGVKHKRLHRLDMSEKQAQEKIKLIEKAKTLHDDHIRLAKDHKKEAEAAKSDGKEHYEKHGRKYLIDPAISHLNDHIKHHENKLESHNNHIKKIEQRHETDAAYFDKKREKSKAKKQEKAPKKDGLTFSDQKEYMSWYRKQSKHDQENHKLDRKDGKLVVTMTGKEPVKKEEPVKKVVVAKKEEKRLPKKAVIVKREIIDVPTKYTDNSNRNNSDVNRSKESINEGLMILKAGKLPPGKQESIERAIKNSMDRIDGILEPKKDSIGELENRNKTLIETMKNLSSESAFRGGKVTEEGEKLKDEWRAAQQESAGIVKKINELKDKKIKTEKDSKGSLISRSALKTLSTAEEDLKEHSYKLGTIHLDRISSHLKFAKEKKLLPESKLENIENALNDAKRSRSEALKGNKNAYKGGPKEEAKKVIVKKEEDKKPISKKAVIVPREKITDFGEKIGGARKDEWKNKYLKGKDIFELNDREIVKHVKKDKIWPKPDYEKMIKEGKDPVVAHLIKKVRDGLPAKLNLPSYKESQLKEYAQKYVQFIQDARETLLKVKTVDDFKDVISKIFHDEYEKGKGWTVTGADPSKAYFYNSRVRKAMSISTWDISRSKKEVDKGWGLSEPWMKDLTIKEYPINLATMKRDDPHTFMVKGEGVTSPYFESEKEATDWAKTRHEALKDHKVTHGEVSKKNKETGEWEKKSGWFATKGSTIMSEVMGTKKAVEDYLMLQHTLKPEAGKKKQKPKFIRPQLRTIERTGKEHRKGESTTTKDFHETFGFKGGEFGNWNTQSDRQQTMDHASDAMNDLADAIGIDPKEISFNGDLSIAFGARGQGFSGASAHYEPDRKVINLTKMKGAGSLAHEWGHGLDDYIRKVSGTQTVKSKMATDALHPKEGGLSAEQVKAFNNIVETMTRKKLPLSEHQENLKKEIEKHTKGLKSTLAGIREDLVKSKESGNKLITDAGLKEFDKEIVPNILKGPSKGDKQIQDGKKKYDFIHEKLHYLTNEFYKDRIGRNESRYKNNLQYYYNNIGYSKESLAKGSDVTLPKRDSNFKKGARKMGDLFGKSSYWPSNVEMFGRAFESYVHDKVKAKGNKSDYLVHSTSNDNYQVYTDPKTGEYPQPYPEGKERVEINKAFDNFFKHFKKGSQFQKPSKNMKKAFKGVIIKRVS